MTKEPEITARDQLEASLDQLNHGVAQRGGLPQLGGDPRLAEDRNGDLAIAGAVHTPVGGLKLEAQTPSLVGRHAGVAWHGAPIPGAPQPGDSLNPVERIVVKGDQR
jgi:hypothetical protein